MNDRGTSKTVINRRGLSTIVANVLIVLVAVMAVSLLWIGISPMLAVDIMSYDTSVSLVTSGGYTFYDEFDESVTVQVESSGSEAPDYIQIILTLEDGNELISAHDAPPLNGRMRYYLNVEDYLGNPPLLISVAPMFIIEGEVILGRRSNAIELPKRVESDPEEFYGDREAVDATDDDTTGGVAGDYVSSGNGDGDPEGGGDSEGGGNVIEIDECRELGEEGAEYLLTDNIPNAGGTCFIFSGNNIILDLGGKTISSSGTGNAIDLKVQNDIVVMNGSIEDFSNGIYVETAGNIEIVDLNLDGNERGVYVIQSLANNVFSNLFISDSSEDGVYLIDVHNSEFYNITLRGEDGNANSGVRLDGSTNNVFDNVVTSGNVNGISLTNSDDNKFFDVLSTMESSHDQWGIKVVLSDRNSFDNVTVELQSINGILLENSEYNTFENANVSDNDVGVVLGTNSQYNTLDGEFCSNWDDDVFCSAQGSGNQVNGKYNDPIDSCVLVSMGAREACVCSDTDEDGDGRIADYCEGGDDCDDTDSNIPLISECADGIGFFLCGDGYDFECNDGKDNDCDGLIDSLDVDDCPFA
jgi:parallel beta-helix repeat protein